jgi:hypothetical protein
MKIVNKQHNDGIFKASTLNISKQKHLDILNSKIKKLHIELPNYVFNHSSSSKSFSHPSLFLGRKELIEKLTNLFNNTSTRKGVYLITGNRGVGKSSLIEEVIKRTSLTKKYFSSELKFISLLLICVLVLKWGTDTFDFKLTNNVTLVGGFCIILILLMYVMEGTIKWLL